MIDGGYSSTEQWQVIAPVAATNLVTCSSFEVATTGWSATSGAISRVAGGTFGAWMLRLLASAQNGRAEYSGPQLTVGTLVVASAWVKATSALVVLRLAYGATVVDQAHPGDGLWHRLEVAGVAQSAVTPIIGIRDGRSSAWANVDADGVQFESGVVRSSSYIDGDQDGSIWNGAPHLSTSTRDGRDGRGGEVVSLESLGLYVTQVLGSGAPPVDVGSQDSALSDGEIFQRSRNKIRVLTLMGIIIGDGTPGALHTIRRGLMDVFRPDGRTNRGPITLRYSGSATPKLLRTYYQSGLEMDGIESTFERMPLRLVATDPDFLGETDEQAALTASGTLTPVSGMALRNTDGTWSSLGGGFTAATNGIVYAVQELLDGRLVIGGQDTLNMGGVAAADYVGVWDGTAMAVLGSAAANESIVASALGNDGTLYASGNFTTIGGNSAAHIAGWNPATNAWLVIGTGGTTPASLPFKALAIDPATGYLWGAGPSATPTTAGGVTVSGLGLWNGTAWVAVSQAGLPSSWSLNEPQNLISGPDGRMYMGVASPTTKGVYVFNASTATWVLFVETTGTSNGVYAMLSANGKLYVGGIFTALGGVAANNIAEVSGSGVSSMAGGVLSSTAFGVRSIAASADGLIHIGGRDFTSMGGVIPVDSIGTWNGSSWQPFAADLPNTGTHANDAYKVHSTRGGRLVMSWRAASGTFGTTLTTEAVTTVVNTGSAPAFPVVRFDAAGTVYTLANLTTGQRINFYGCVVGSGEVATLDLRPGRKTFSAPLRNLLSTILPGSDLSTFMLAPGSNRLVLMATAGTVAMYWRPRNWSAD